MNKKQLALGTSYLTLQIAGIVIPPAFFLGFLYFSALRKILPRKICFAILLITFVLITLTPEGLSVLFATPEAVVLTFLLYWFGSSWLSRKVPAIL